MAQTFDQASTVSAEQGDVYVDGPGNVAYAMSPEAALLTSDRMLASAAEAQGQRVEAQRLSEAAAARHTRPTDP